VVLTWLAIRDIADHNPSTANRRQGAEDFGMGLGNDGGAEVVETGKCRAEFIWAELEMTWEKFC